MEKITKNFANSMLTGGKLLNNNLYINNRVIKDYEIASFNTSNFS